MKRRKKKYNEKIKGEKKIKEKEDKVKNEKNTRGNILAKLYTEKLKKIISA